MSCSPIRLKKCKQYWFTDIYSTYVCNDWLIIWYMDTRVIRMYMYIYIYIYRYMMYANANTLSETYMFYILPKRAWCGARNMWRSWQLHSEGEEGRKTHETNPYWSENAGNMMAFQGLAEILSQTLWNHLNYHEILAFVGKMQPTMLSKERHFATQGAMILADHGRQPLSDAVGQDVPKVYGFDKSDRCSLSRTSKTK